MLSDSLGSCVVASDASLVCVWSFKFVLWLKRFHGSDSAMNVSIGNEEDFGYQQIMYYFWIMYHDIIQKCIYLVWGENNSNNLSLKLFFLRSKQRAHFPALQPYLIPHWASPFFLPHDSCGRMNNAAKIYICFRVLALMEASSFPIFLCGLEHPLLLKIGKSYEEILRHPPLWLLCVACVQGFAVKYTDSLYGGFRHPGWQFAATF